MSGFLIYDFVKSAANIECQTLFCADLHMGARGALCVIVHNDGSLPFGKPLSSPQIAQGVERVKIFRKLCELGLHSAKTVAMY